MKKGWAKKKLTNWFQESQALVTSGLGTEYIEVYYGIFKKSIIL